MKTLLGISFFLSFSAIATTSSTSFTNIATDPANGIDWQRTPSAEFAIVQQLREQSLVEPVSFADFLVAPHRATGLPGVAILDADRDGDLDIYATNGPGTANSLFINQLDETGHFTFVDEGAQRGAGVEMQDSQGVCFGDFDNDGDDDIYVLSRNSTNVLLVNNGAGHFSELDNDSVEAGDLNHTSCSVGDIDNDGLLDIVISNTFDFFTLLPILAEPYALNQPNQLFRNEGGLVFSDISDSSGIRVLNGLDQAPDNAATISWAVSMVDVDRDNDMDIVFADDQAGIARESIGGLDRGFLQVMLNDGTGQFTSTPITEPGVPQYAAPWMGLSWGDFNCDQNLDFFASNFGDYDSTTLGVPLPYFYFDEASRPLLGRGDGLFDDPSLNGEATAFGWGNAVFDADNDGDHDVVYQGGMNLTFGAIIDNPGVLLINEGCEGSLRLELGAFNNVDHTRRIDQGLATGDLNEDGYVDIVVAASEIMHPDSILVPSPASYGSVLDATSFFSPQFFEVGPDQNVYAGLDSSPGTLSVEINDGGDAGSVSFDLVGTGWLDGGGNSNRSGIGAIVEFKKPRSHRQTSPVVGGSSFASQHTLRQHFGLGSSHGGRVFVDWPGGFRNAYGWTHEGQQRVLPEIPCSYDDPEFDRMRKLVRCVKRATRKLRQEGIIHHREARLIDHAMRRAWWRQ